MLERYFVRPDTVDRIRASWIGEPIERYVAGLTEQGYAARNVFRRVPILTRFGEFAREQGAQRWEDLPSHVQGFVDQWVQQRGGPRVSDQRRQTIIKEVRTPVEQLVRLVVSSFVGTKRQPAPAPFREMAPDFFTYLREERGLRAASLAHYAHHLRCFEAYLDRIELAEVRSLSPPVLAAFVADRSAGVCRTSLRDCCGVLRVFLRYLHRSGVLPTDLSPTVESPQVYRLSSVPRSITWEEVRRMLAAVDRRAALGKRDYAILLLLVTYGLRAREVAALTLDDIDWRRERLRIPERKAGHSTAFPLSTAVGEALVDYLRNGRPQTTDRHVFFRVVAPPAPLTYTAIGARASHYLHRAGITVARAGSHTLRHTCVQRLVDADFSLKVIGDYVGHRSPSSTEIYTKVAVETLRQVALGDGEEIL
ncbi:MAG TPA: site-specific integrase [Candidatus Margulisiibacteriota bacterium]|nr:site-specific integrase [Candidatus Margulisiibacteriota bacterium]